MCQGRGGTGGRRNLCMVPVLFMGPRVPKRWAV